MKVAGRIAKQKSKLTVSLASAMAALMLTGQAFAMPVGGNVVSGTININDLANITVGTNGIIEWNKFNIGTGEAVNFNFTGSANGVLNRVTGGNISSIQGLLSSSGNNGMVALVNPAGIVFGAGATINVPTFIASTLDAKNEMFLNMMKDGNVTTIGAGTTKGNIEVNGNLSLVSGTTFVGIGNSIIVAPGVSITTTATTTGTDTGLELYAANSLNTLSKIHGDGRIYTNVSGVTTNAENTITVGEGSTLSAASVTLMGNSININGTADKKVKIISPANTLNGDYTIVAVNDIAFSYDVNSNTDIATGTATSANTVNISHANIGTAGNDVASPLIRITGGQVTIDNSNLNFGGTQNYWGHSTSNSAYIVAGNSFTNTSDDNTGLDISWAWKATPDNTINITSTNIGANLQNGKILENNRLAILGGKVDVANSSIKVGEFFVGAGTSMSLEANKDYDNNSYYDEFYFSNTAGATTAGSTVNFDVGSNVSASGEAAVYANAITNNGKITATNMWGIHLTAFDKYNMGINAYTGEVSSNNTITNNGTIIATNQLEISANKFINNKIITMDNNAVINVVVADRMSGNAIEGTNLSSTIIQGIDDPHYNANTPFNRIIGTVTGDDPDNQTINWSFATVGSSNASVDEIINSTISLDEKKNQIAQVASNITSGSAAAEVLNTILDVNNHMDETAKSVLLNTMVHSYAPTQSSLTQSTSQINSSTKSNAPTTAIAPTQTPVAVGGSADTVVTVVPTNAPANDTKTNTNVKDEATKK